MSKTSDRSRMGRRNRQKGQECERELVAALRSYWPEAIRGLQCRGEVDAVADVEHTPIRWECKSRASHVAMSLLDYADAEADAAGDTRPVALALRRSGQRRMAVVLWLDEVPAFLAAFAQAGGSDVSPA